MKKFFNVAGPCFPNEHYMLPAQARCPALMPLVEQKTYFCIHAPRQTGKTTMVKDFVRELNAGGRYHGMYCSLETAQGIADEAAGITCILDILDRYCSNLPALKGKVSYQEFKDTPPRNAVSRMLAQLCERLDKPLVLMFDEADCLAGPTLISFLRQLREGYVNRDTTPFVHSLALIGLTNIRDYKGQIRKDSETLRSASPFNIVTSAMTIRNFTCEEVAALYAQHTEATRQVFPEQVVNEVFRVTCGQPYLVNAIAREIVENILERDEKRPILLKHVEQATQTLILNRVTHIDSLMERLREDRIRRIIEPMITGEERKTDPLEDDFQYVSDLGLIKLEGGALKPANPIYGEVILRTLNFRIQHAFDEGQYPFAMPRYVEGGRINMRMLFGEFQQFWRMNSEIWDDIVLYKEAAPHLIMTGFLQRVVNAQGSISREFAAGRGRMDLCIHFSGVAYPIELKVIRAGQNPGQITDKGIEQIHGYMNTVGTREGWLVLFDQRPGISWDDRIFWREREHSGAVIHCVGC
ncbi:MAG: AAA-like domain-containing protein [Candidatus Sumerlaeota bacterium]|nr:AAA-like domain-containing protein [Candidatus Sumerlaeota bacterium]